MDWGRKGLNEINDKKTRFFSFDCLNSYGVIDVKIDESAFDRKPPSKMLKLLFSLQIRLLLLHCLCFSP